METYIRSCTNKMVDLCYRGDAHRKKFPKAIAPYVVLSGLVLSSAKLVVRYAPAVLALPCRVVAALVLARLGWKILSVNTLSPPSTIHPEASKTEEKPIESIEKELKPPLSENAHAVYQIFLQHGSMNGIRAKDELELQVCDARMVYGLINMFKMTPQDKLKEFCLASIQVRELIGLSKGEGLPEKVNKLFNTLTREECESLMKMLFLWSAHSKKFASEPIEKRVFAFLGEIDHLVGHVFFTLLDAAYPWQILSQVVSLRNSSSQTALMHAAQVGNLALARLLMRAGASRTDVNPSDLPNMAFNYAIESGHFEIFLELLPIDDLPPAEPATAPAVRADRQSCINRALAQAAKKGKLEVIKKLLAVGVTRNTTYQGATALFWAAQSGKIEIVDLLLRANMSPIERNVHNLNVRLPRDYSGATAVFGTLEWGAPVETRVEILKRLLTAGANMLIPPHNVPLINARKDGGQTALMTAAELGDLRMVEALLQEGAIVADRNPDNGMTPLMYAIFAQHEELIQPLLDAGAPLATQDHDGRTALMYAALDFSDGSEAGRAKSVNIVKKLLAAGAQVTDRNLVNGMTPLMYLDPGMGTYSIEMLQALLNAGALLTDRDLNGMTPLMHVISDCAGCAGEVTVVEKLLHAGASGTDVDHRGNTVLMHAIRRGYLDILQALLAFREIRETIDQRNGAGESALTIAMQRPPSCCIALMYALIQAGAHVPCGRQLLDDVMMSKRPIETLLVFILSGIYLQAVDEEGKTLLESVEAAVNERIAIENVQSIKKGMFYSQMLLILKYLQTLEESGGSAKRHLLGLMEGDAVDAVNVRVLKKRLKKTMKQCEARKKLAFEAARV